MAVYAISDLHLALSVDKPMDVFGDRWSGYMEKIVARWKEYVSPDDYVVIPGDISWATYLEDAITDFRYIDSLPGRKVISKGNHDYWWTTQSKLEQFLSENNINTVSFMHNNSFKLEKIILCGTRGWKCPGDKDFSEEDKKIYNRELQRLELSLKSIKERQDEKIVVALHYPPFNYQKQASDFVKILKEYKVDKCIYGHLHGYGFKSAVQGIIDGIDFKLISADYLDFIPFKIY